MRPRTDVLNNRSIWIDHLLISVVRHLDNRSHRSNAKLFKDAHNVAIATIKHLNTTKFPHFDLHARGHNRKHLRAGPMSADTTRARPNVSSCCASVLSDSRGWSSI